MSEGLILSNNENKKISSVVKYALTVILYEDLTVELSPETSIDNKDFYLDLNEAYRIICDAKNQLEIIRFKEQTKDFVVDFLNKLSEEEGNEEENEFDV